MENEKYEIEKLLHDNHQLFNENQRLKELLNQKCQEFNEKYNRLLEMVQRRGL